MKDRCLQVGSLVVAKRDSGVCREGERGVCYELYELGRRPGYSIIFERGGHDGFSPQDVEMFLEVTGVVLPSIEDFEFRNVMQLRRAFERGRFAEAFGTFSGRA